MDRGTAPRRARCRTQHPSPRRPGFRILDGLGIPAIWTGEQNYRWTGNIYNRWTGERHRGGHVAGHDTRRLVDRGFGDHDPVRRLLVVPVLLHFLFYGYGVQNSASDRWARLSAKRPCPILDFVCASFARQRDRLWDQPYLTESV